MPIQLLFISSLAFFLFVLVEVLIRNYSQQVNSVLFVFRRTVLTLIFSISWLVASGTLQKYPNFNGFSQLIICAFLMAMGLIGFVESNKHLSITNILSIQMIGIFVKLVFFNHIQYSGTGMLIFTSVLMAIGLFLHVSLPENRIGVFWALLSMIGWCVGYEFIVGPLNEFGPAWTVVVIEGVLLILTIFLLLIRGNVSAISNIFKEIDAPVVVIALLTSLGVLVMAYGAKFFPIHMVNIVNISIYPISILLLRYIFNEIIITREWIGNALICMAVFLFYIFNY
jgi:drug/metabolite transporter (DMT)-like permease